MKRFLLVAVVAALGATLATVIGAGAATPTATTGTTATSPTATATTPTATTPTATTPASTTPGSKTRAEVSVSVSSTQLESRLRSSGLQVGVSCSESCSIKQTLQFGGRKFSSSRTVAGKATRKIVGGPGKTLVKIPISSTVKREILSPGTETFVLRTRVTDSDGNTTAPQDRLIRDQRLGGRRSNG